MQIIKEGVIPDKNKDLGKFFKVECSNCGCIFIVHESETIKSDHVEEKITGGAFAPLTEKTKYCKYTVQCPCCNDNLIADIIHISTSIERINDLDDAPPLIRF